MNDSKETLTAADLSTLKFMNSFIFDVLGLEDEK
jgi:hypothetical protein